MKRLTLLAVGLIMATVIGCNLGTTPLLPTAGPAPTVFPIDTFTMQLATIGER